MDVTTRYIVATACLVVGVIAFIDRVPVPLLSAGKRREYGGMALFCAVIMFIWALGGPNAV